MKTAQPILGFERLLTALEQDLLEATDEEILAVAHELGMKPGMKGSIALFGVTFAARLNIQDRQQTDVATYDGSAPRPRRRPKGDTSSSN